MGKGAKTASLEFCSKSEVDTGRGITIPYYLTAHYSWAYVHPMAVKLFERQWLVNLLLWGNYARLRDAALSELRESLAGSTLQVACVYGDLTNRLSGDAERAGGSVDVVDVLPVQLRNLRDKLPKVARVRLLAMDAAALELPDASYDNCLVFFLLHEQPRPWREHTLREVLRVVKPGGKIVIIDYARPRWWHPLRYLWRPLLAKLEPFALDLWREEIADWLPRYAAVRSRKQVFFGGLYQKLVITRLECRTTAAKIARAPESAHPEGPQQSSEGMYGTESTGFSLPMHPDVRQSNPRQLLLGQSRHLANVVSTAACGTFRVSQPSAIAQTIALHLWYLTAFKRSQRSTDTSNNIVPSTLFAFGVLEIKTVDSAARRARKVAAAVKDHAFVDS